MRSLDSYSIQSKAGNLSRLFDSAMLTCGVTQVYSPIAIVKGSCQLTKPRLSTIAIECAIICRQEGEEVTKSSCCTLFAESGR